MRYRERVNVKDLDDLNEDVKELKAENKILLEKMEGVELALGFMRSLLVMVLVFSICLFIFVMGVILKNM